MSRISDLLFNNNNQRGDVGEWIASTRLSQNHIFSVHVLGGKTPIFDLVVEINDQKHPYQFLIQVKATEAKKRYSSPGKIHTPVEHGKYKKLVGKPLPSYIAGIDLVDEVMYIYPAFDKSKKVSAVPTKYKLSKEDRTKSKQNLERLRDDVISYWQGLKIDTYKPSYKSSL